MVSYVSVFKNPQHFLHSRIHLNAAYHADNEQLLKFNKFT